MLTFFDAFGYNSGSSILSSQRMTANVIYVLHFTMAIYFTWFIYDLKIRLSPYAGLLELLNHLLQYFSTILMTWFTIWDSFHWREHHLFWGIFHKVNESVQSQRNFSCRLLVLKLFWIIFTTFLSLLISYSSVDIPKPFEDIVIINTILVKLCQIRIFYYLFCLEVINFQLNSIKSVLQKMRKPIIIGHTAITNVKQFKWLFTYYSYVYEMSNLLNVIFDWSQLTAVSFCFYTLLTDLNWFFVHLTDHSSGHFLGEC